MADNKTTLPTQCVHLTREQRSHVHTLVLETVDASDADGYRHITGPDRMKLCDLCAGILIGSMGKLGKGDFT